MTTATENPAVDISHWIPGTRFFDLSDGRHVVVCVDETELPAGGRIKVRRQPTTIFYTDANGVAEDLIPDFVSDPGTSCEAALQAAGFTTI